MVIGRWRAIPGFLPCQDSIECKFPRGQELADVGSGSAGDLAGIAAPLYPPGEVIGRWGRPFDPSRGAAAVRAKNSGRLEGSDLLSPFSSRPYYRKPGRGKCCDLACKSVENGCDVSCMEVVG